MKATRITLTDPTTQRRYQWTARRFENATLCITGKPTRKISGWSFTDHEGYLRNVEGSWNDLVWHLQLVANNYGLVAKIS